ncbi:hypothetical protein CJU89_3718 [Yarrowia sp. B02]|nr:hypothetical protein CJU89_3718 [Yarrowia sp. B02]
MSEDFDFEEPQVPARPSRRPNTSILAPDVEPIVREHDKAIAEVEDAVPEPIAEVPGSEGNPIALDDVDDSAKPSIPSRRPKREAESAPPATFMPTPVTEATYDEPSFNVKIPKKGMTTEEAAALEHRQEEELKAELQKPSIPSRPSRPSSRPGASDERATPSVPSRPSVERTGSGLSETPSVPSRPSRPSSRPAHSSESETSTPSIPSRPSSRPTTERTSSGTPSVPERPARPERTISGTSTSTSGTPLVPERPSRNTSETPSIPSRPSRRPTEEEGAFRPSPVASSEISTSSPTGMTTAQAAALEHSEEKDYKAASTPFHPEDASRDSSLTPDESRDALTHRIARDKEMGIAVGLGPMDKPVPRGVPKDDMALLHDSLSESRDPRCCWR